jgi:hypothetical protein
MKICPTNKDGVLFKKTTRRPLTTLRNCNPYIHKKTIYFLFVNPECHAVSVVCLNTMSAAAVWQRVKSKNKRERRSTMRLFRLESKHELEQHLSLLSLSLLSFHLSLAFSLSLSLSLSCYLIKVWQERALFIQSQYNDVYNLGSISHCVAAPTTTCIHKKWPRYV